MSLPLSNEMQDVVAIRRHLHQIPELGLSEFKTSDFIADQLVQMGYDVTRGLAKTGIVATLRNGSSNRSIGIRADIVTDFGPLAALTDIVIIRTVAGVSSLIAELDNIEEIAINTLATTKSMIKNGIKIIKPI